MVWSPGRISGEYMSLYSNLVRLQLDHYGLKQKDEKRFQSLALDYLRLVKLLKEAESIIKEFCYNDIEHEDKLMVDAVLEDIKKARMGELLTPPKKGWK